MRKKKKVNKIRLISRAIVLLIILLIIVLLFKVMLKKDNNILDLTLVVDNQDITDNLQKDIYIDKDKNLYMTTEDIKNVFDKNLYFEEETGKIITTSDTKVGAIDVNNNTFELNSANLMISSGIIKYDTGYYIPISEIAKIYNIEVFTTENSAVVSSLYKELITVKITKKTSLKKKCSVFSNTIQKLEEGKELICLDNEENSQKKSGWMKVLTYEGKIGYIKEKDISEKENKRTNMNNSDFSSKSVDENNSIGLTKEVLNSNNLKTFDNRKKTIQNTISDSISKERYTVLLDLKEVEVEEKLLERFIIELMPRLKEIGGNVVIINNSVLSDNFINENKL